MPEKLPPLSALSFQSVQYEEERDLPRPKVDTQPDEILADGGLRGGAIHRVRQASGTEEGDAQ
jgi:hypothetical protein